MRWRRGRVLTLPRQRSRAGRTPPARLEGCRKTREKQRLRRPSPGPNRTPSCWPPSPCSDWPPCRAGSTSGRAKVVGWVWASGPAGSRTTPARSWRAPISPSASSPTTSARPRVCIAHGAPEHKQFMDPRLEVNTANLRNAYLAGDPATVEQRHRLGKRAGDRLRPPRRDPRPPDRARALSGARPEIWPRFALALRVRRPAGDGLRASALRRAAPVAGGPAPLMAE